MSGHIFQCPLQCGCVHCQVIASQFKHALLCLLYEIDLDPLNPFSFGGCLRHFVRRRDCMEEGRGTKRKECFPTYVLKCSQCPSARTQRPPASFLGSPPLGASVSAVSKLLQCLLLWG